MQRIDSHCHIFNITTVGWKAILGELHGILGMISLFDNLKQEDLKTKRLKGKLNKRISRLAELIKIFTTDSENILEMLDNHYNGEYAFFPLMFDGDFLLNSYDDENLSFLKSLLKHKTYKGKKVEKGADFSGLRVDEKLLQISHPDRDIILSFLDRISGNVINEKQTKSNKDGFTIQFDEIINIISKDKYEERVFPFLGVDPRRKDIKSLVKKYVGKGKPFSGIKVYPPNGFSPMDKKLVGNNSIFEYCELNKIPVVTHCSYGGFATPANKIDINGMIIPKGKRIPIVWDGEYVFSKRLTLKIGKSFDKLVRERAGVLNHTKIWEKVLELHPNLILTFAHFGNGSKSWQEAILEILKNSKYPNVFTDISCMSKDLELKRVKRIYVENSKVRGQILYGSDYFLDMFFNDSFDIYLDRIKNNFSKKEFDQLSIINPSNYMNEWYKI